MWSHRPYYRSVVNMLIVGQWHSIVSLGWVTISVVCSRNGEWIFKLDNKAVKRRTEWEMLQKFQIKKAELCLARGVFKAPKFCHITPILKFLHWLKINERIEYKRLSLTHKALTTAQLLICTAWSLFSPSCSCYSLCWWLGYHISVVCSHTQWFIPGSKLTISTNRFHHSLLTPTWTAFQGRSDEGYIGIYTPKSVTVLFTCGILTYVLKLQWPVKTYTPLPKSNSWLRYCFTWPL